MDRLRQRADFLAAASGLRVATPGQRPAPCAPLPLPLAGSLRVCAAIVDVFENNRTYRNLLPFCEPQLGRRGLYRTTGGNGIGSEISARLWVLNFSDGEHSLLDIAERSDLPFAIIRSAAETLFEHGLLQA